MLLFFALQATWLGWTYIFGDPAWFDPLFADKYTRHLILVRTHAAGAGVALVGGLMAFWPGSRRYGFHRYLGRLYLPAVLIASFTALPMSVMAEGGFITRASFFFLATLWLVTGGLAYTSVKRGEYANHRRWMVRNYALTYSAVLSRLLLNLLLELGLPFQQIYPVVSWSWLGGVAAGEWWLIYSSRRHFDEQKGA